MGYGRPFYKKPLFYIVLALLAAIVAGVITVVSVVSQKNKEAEEAERIKTESDEYWADYIDRGAYSETIRELLEGDYKTDLSGTTWEYALYDLDLDGRDELFLRINFKKNEDGALTFAICLVDGKPSVAGVYKGGSYPLFSEKHRAFESPSAGEVITDHEFYRLEDGKCVLAYRLYEDGGAYKIKQDGVTSTIPSEEYGEYFSDCVFLDWTHFYSKFIYNPNYSSQDDPVLILPETVGEVPEEFRRIIDNDLFYGARYSGGRIVKTASGYATDRTSAIITAYDIYGHENARAEISYEPEEGYKKSMTGVLDYKVTSDGGFVIAAAVYSFEADKTDEQGETCSIRLLKLGISGKVEWDSCVLENHLVSGVSVVEWDDGYYVFVSVYDDVVSSGLTGGIYPGNIALFKLSRGGEILKTVIIEPDAFSYLTGTAKRDGDKMIIYLTKLVSQSFYSSYIEAVYSRVTIDGKDMSYEIEEDVEYSHDLTRAIGELDGEEIYSYSRMILELGEPGVTLVLDYGDCFIAVSDFSSIISFDLALSSVYPKLAVSTVYSAYSKDCKLLWRAYGKSK
ncbi:MAG: hypothetical protein IJS45_07640 [Clostridia bacterium]|nr:hypothetical protein [Clostridia bacterium]